MNSNNIYSVFGNDKNNEIPQNKLNNFNVNYTSSKPKIIRDSTSNELIAKFFHKRENASPKNSTNLKSRNKKLEFKKLSKSINKNDIILSNQLFNLSYQDKPELSKNDDSINNLKQKGTIQEYKQKIKESSNSFYEKLMPVTKKERNEGIKDLNKNELNSLDKTNKKAKSMRKFKSERINNKNSQKRINELEEENKKLKEENNKLEKELEDKDEIIKMQQLKIKDHENTIKETKINNNKELEKLLDEIKKIKSIIPFDILPGEKIMSIIFKSDDQNILYSVVCKNTDQFTRIKYIIYDKYPEYKESENHFLFNGEKINENKTLEDNKIKDGSLITIYSNYDLK